jgi:hypothetical protein
MRPYQPTAKTDLVGADFRAAPQNGMVGRTGLLTGITAASEMRPYQPTAKTDPVGADLPAARPERHGRQNWASHRDNGRLGDAFRRGVFIA